MLHCALVAGAQADEVLTDLAGRVEYSFYAGDIRSLQQSVELLEKLDGVGAELDQRDSYLNYGRWKLAQLQAVSNPAQAQQRAQQCAEFKPNPRSVLLATQHAITAACYGMLEKLRPLRRVLYHGERAAALEQAQQLGAQQAQVQFVVASLALAQDDIAQAQSALKQALQLYNQNASSPAGASSPSGASTSALWGQAEVLFLSGKLALAQGNALAARDVLEQALVLAPDYQDAARLLRTLSLK